MKITNLDSILAEDQKFIIDGKEWIIPGEISFNSIISLIGLQQKLEENPTDFDVWENQMKIVLNIFNKNHPDLTMEQLKEMLSARQVGILVAKLMQSLGPQIEEDEEEKKTELLEENQSRSKVQK